MTGFQSLVLLRELALYLLKCASVPELYYLTLTMVVYRFVQFTAPKEHTSQSAIAPESIVSTHSNLEYGTVE